MEIQDCNDSAFKHALARNVRSLTKGKKSSKQPIAILLGWQSGAGKTTIHRIKQKEFQGILKGLDGTVVTITDENGAELSFDRKDIALIRLAVLF